MKDSMRRFLSFVLALVLVVGLIPSTGLVAHATETETDPQVDAELGLESMDKVGFGSKTLEDFAGKKVSFLGDSITTYAGVSNSSSYNTTLKGSAVYYKGTDSMTQADTWWQQVIDLTGMELCVNNSWSGSCILTTRAGTVGAYVDRCVQLHNDHNGEEPEVIMIFLGTNDFSYFSKGSKDTWGSIEDVDYTTLFIEKEDGSYYYKETPETVYEAYAIILHKMKQRYPDAEIYCMGLMARRDPIAAGDDVGQPDVQNEGLKALAKHFDCGFIDMSTCITSDPDNFDQYMGDKRVHPNKAGMDQMTQAVVSGLLGKEITVCDLSYDLTNVKSSNTSNILMSGEPYETVLKLDSAFGNMDVTVTMGGKDVTAQCYEDGKVSIAKVTGDVEITAFGYGAAIPNDLKHRWEMNSDGTALVSVTTDGFVENALTKTSGSIKEGTLSSYAAKLDDVVTLKPDDEWIIEWKSSGDWSGMFLTSATSPETEGAMYLYRSATKILSIGIRENNRYNNYGIDTSEMDLTEAKTFRLENRVAKDGSNMVYLVIDGMEIGAMNNYYIASSSKGTSDWLNNQELNFRYAGASGFTVKNMKLEYLEILDENSHEHRHTYACTEEVKGTCSTEGYFTYACRCGDSYQVSNGQLGAAHVFEGWAVVDGVLRRECKHCDAYETEELQGYRWEMNDAGDALVSVTTDGNVENVLTVTSGAVKDGKLTNMTGKLTDTVTLSPDSEWVIEWESNSNWNGMLLLSNADPTTKGTVYLYRNAKKLLVFGANVNGTFHNYGIDTTGIFDDSTVHKFRMENRVADDGSNMVYLVVDDMEIGAMNNYYIASASQNKTSDWLNNQELKFSFMGSSSASFIMNNMDLNYLQIWMNGAVHQHAYAVTGEEEGTCIEAGYIEYTCTTCGDQRKETTDTSGMHSYGDWVNTDTEMHRTCVNCGTTETKELYSYRWQINEAGDAFENVVGDYNRENALTLLSGSISSGKFTDIQYQLANTITLKPEDSWVIEWQAKGDWNGMLFSSHKENTNGMVYVFRKASTDLLALGTLNGTNYNYGMETTDLIDIKKTHNFRLENRVAADGSNMVYLIVDGIELGAMDRYFKIITDSGKTEDWVNGREFTFDYIGKTGHLLTNITLEYLQVWVNGTGHRHAYKETSRTESTCSTLGETTHTCSCGEVTVTKNLAYGEHSFGEWVTEGDEQRRYCQYCEGYESNLLKGYRWEYSSETNELRSVITNGNKENELNLMTGNISEGFFENVVYKLEETINLSHDAPWIIEWESSGDWNGMLLSSDTGTVDGMNFIFRKNSTDLLAIGNYETGEEVKYNNYGIVTTEHFDIAEKHIFRLENRINEDGSNMVYLVVDNVEVGPMNNYFKATTNQKQVVDWLNGQDLTFNYIGKSSNAHHLTEINLSYLQVLLNGADEHMHAYIITEHDPGNCQTEGVNTYLCPCGDTYTASTGKLGNHLYSKWTIVEDERQCVCTLCGEIQSVPLNTHYDESVSNNYYNVISQKNYILCDGITESEVVINNSSASRRQVLHVVEVDPYNPNVEILPGYYGIDKDLTNSDNWSAVTMETMMDYYRDELGYNVVGGMNTALSYDSDAPCYFLVYNGEVLADANSIYTKGADTFLAVIKNDDGTVTCELRDISDGLQGDEWHAVSCNFGYVVKDGKLVSKTPNRGTGADRSMIGIKADGTLVIVQSEGRNAPYAVGLSAYEEGEAMLALGCVWAVNGDGGGSSQILTKREGESNYQLRNIPSDGTPRATINGIIVASKAKADGVFDHASLLVEHEYITPAGSVKVEVKGVDGSGMPAGLPEDITYGATGGSFVDGVFTSDGTLGEQTLTAYCNGEEVGSTTVNVVIPTSISYNNAAMAVPYGKTVEIPISAYYNTFPVALCGADVEFKLSAEIGMIDGLSFTALSEEMAGEANTADMTATLVHNRELTAVIPVYVGKGSEVLYDFEDQDLHGWYRTTAANYNAIRVGGETYLVDASTGHVRSGDYAMAVELDFSNSIEPGFLLGTLNPGERVVLENAQSIGMWVYFPDEAEPVRIDTQVPVVASKELPVTQRYLTPAASVAEAGETDIAEVGFISAYDESGWHYISIDLSSEEFTMLPTLKFYVCQKDGKNGYIYGEQPNANGKYILYVDDITVDYSQAVDDRETPVFNGMTYQSAEMDEALELNGDTVYSNTVTFSTTVADNMKKNNYSGVNATRVHAYIDGADYTDNLTVSGLGELSLTLNGISLPSGMHKVKFVAYDNMGNRAAIERSIIVGAEDASDIRVVPHDPDAERILLGSLYYVDVVADNPENISSVTVTLDLNNISVWELDHMDVAKGFEATYSLIADEDIATVTITANGKTNLSGENQILASIPVRTWELPIVEPIRGHDGRVYMYDSYRATNSILPMGLYLDVDGGYVDYKDGSGHIFSGPRVQVTTEHSGNAHTSSGSAALNYIGDEPWYETWNGGHDHRPETKQYYLEGSTNHVDAIALEDKAATCEEDGYTNRTYCEVCKSVVDWGTTIEATGHIYDFVDGVLKCECGDLFNGIYTDGKAYIDGIVSDVNGWFDDAYFVDGVALTGVHKVPSPKDPSVEYYYDFGENGICKNRMKYTGIFRDGDVYRYSYIGELVSGWYTIDDNWYYFSPETMANVSGKYTINDIEFEFEENGKLKSGVWKGKQYWYGPSYYEDFWYEIDGELYYFVDGYAQTGVQYVRKYGYLERTWAKFDDNGVFLGYLEGFITDEEGHLFYYVEGTAQIGLQKIDGDYYFFTYDTGAVTGVKNCWATNCDLPVGTYEFGADFKMLQGLVQKEDGLYYYINGKVGPAGLTKIGDDYYFVDGKGKCATGLKNCWATNCDLPTGNYTFGEDGKALQGIVKMEDGFYYYVNGQPGPQGLTKVGNDYYFIGKNSKCATGEKYCWATNCDLPIGTYTFGEDGKMINPPVEPEYLPGDLDNNGVVDDEDVIYLLWHTLMPDDYPVDQNVDFDGNGNVDDEDVIYLLWHTLMPGDYPL